MKNRISTLFLLTLIANFGFTQIPRKCAPGYNKLEDRTINSSDVCNDNLYELVFSEEFDSPLDLVDWRADYPYGCPAGNIHPASPDVIIKPENTFVSGGYLHLLAKKEDVTITCVNNIGQTSQYSAEFSSSVFHSNNNTNTNPNSDHESGCWRWGKFSIRAKVPHDNGSDGMFPSFWFFGWGGEVDVFEFINGSDELTTTIHLWNLEKNGQRPVYTVPTPANTGHLSDDFHEYTFEWTPFKYAFLLDGVEYAQIFRYYEDIGSQPTLSGTDIIQRYFMDGRHHSTLRGLDCDDIPQNQDFQVVYNLAWEKVDDFNLDLIIGNTIDANEFSGTQSELLIDWIRVYQNTSGSLELSDDFICANGETITLEVDGQPTPINWTVSPNLIITNTSQDQRTIQIAPKGNQFGDGWIECRTPNPNSCHETRLRRDVIVGPPPANISVQQDECFITLDASTGSASTGYVWQVIVDGVLRNYITPRIILDFFDTDMHDIDISLFASNECGTSHSTRSFQYQAECGIIKIVSNPNPASTTIEITLDNFNSILSNGEVRIDLVDKALNIARTTKTSFPTFQMDVSGVNNGVYYLITKLLEKNYISTPIFIQHE